MKVLIIAPATYNTSPGQRFRIEQWARHLESDGFEFTYAPFEDDSLHRLLYQRGRIARKAVQVMRSFGRRAWVMRRVTDYDLVYLFREAALAGPPIFERWLARTGVPMVFDFDDAIWVPYVSPANKYLSYLKCFGKAATICRLSTCVLAGNAYLADYARQHNSRSLIVPTTIDTDQYRLRPPAANSLRPVTIGWTGSYSTVQHLDTLRGALLRLSQRRSFRLSVIGAPKYQLDGVETVAKAWSADTEVSDLQGFDIGIMPLPNDNWSRGKCGLKLLQCMGVGTPVVGSPVGVNSDIIKDGINGFLAATEDEWVEKLTQLIDDAPLRTALGLAGRSTVDKSFSARVWAPQVGIIFRSLVSGQQTVPGERQAAALAAPLRLQS